MASNEMLGTVIEEVLEELEDLPSSERANAARLFIAVAVVALLTAAILLRSRRENASSEVATDSAGLTDTGAASPS